MDDPTCNSHDEIETTDDIKFSPPLYEQRYHRVFSILKSEEVKSLVDFGCAECKSLRIFRHLPQLRQLYGVDIDEALLADNAFRIRPLTCDYLLRRSHGLSVQLLVGNLLDPDERLLDIDAVVLIEVIEHLVTEDVARLPEAIFGCLRPRLVVITTPNADFNVLFPALVGFRHWDHKFEWTRDQFNCWSEEVSSKYGYSVTTEGIGSGPAGSEHLGSCSQMAIFRRLRDTTPHDDDFSVYRPFAIYKTVCDVEFPADERSLLSREEQLIVELQYYVRRISIDLASCEDYDDDDDLLIDLDQLMNYTAISSCCDNDLDLLRKAVMKAGYSLSADNRSVIAPPVEYFSRHDCWQDDDNDDDDNFIDYY